MLAATAASRVPQCSPPGDRPGPAPGATVAIRGFALTFIDAALALTEGRGGRFVTAPSIRSGSSTIRPRDRKANPPPLAYGTTDARETGTGRRMTPHLGSAAAEAQRPGGDHGDLETRSRTWSPSWFRYWPIWRRPGRRGEMSRWLELACSGAPSQARADPAAEIRRSLAAGAAPTDVRAWLGTTWRAVYPAVVEKLGGDGLADDQWPAFRRLSAELERVAFGPPPVNAAKLLALIEAGVVELDCVAGAMPRRRRPHRCA